MIRLGDVLHEVDGRCVHRADLGLVAGLVPGDHGTNVELGLKRGGSESGPTYKVLLQRSAGVKTYGAIASPPRSPAGPGARSPWQDGAPSLVVGGNSSSIDDKTAAPAEVAITVSSATGTSVRE